MTAPTPEQTEAMATAGAAVTALVEQLAAELDIAHLHGLHFPPSVAQAAKVLGALGMAWTYNGAGMSCPPEVRRVLA